MSIERSFAFHSGVCAVPSARNDRGFQLVEVLIALLIMGILATNVIQSYSQALKGASNIQNQVLAANIAQEVIDGARNLTWQELTDGTHQGTHTLLVNRKSAGDNPDPAFPRPLLMDQVGLQFSSDGEANLFRADTVDGGSVVQTISAPVNNIVTVTVVVNWKEAGNYKVRSFSQSTQISRWGIHN